MIRLSAQSFSRNRFRLPKVRGVRFIDTAHGKHGETLGQYDDRSHSRVQAVGGGIESIWRWYDGCQH